MAHPHPRDGAIAQSDGTYRQGGTTRTPTSPTIEHYFRAAEARDHEMEDDHGMHHHKKSVLAKVKDKARKWRSTLIKKKHGEDGKSTPSWGVSLEDDEEEEEEDAEYLGAPMYESEMAPEELKETARQHPRADPVISESHVLSGSVNVGSEEKSASAHKPMAENLTETQELVNSPKTLTETITEKLAPAYATLSDATHAIASKIQSLTVSTPEPSSAPAVTNPPAGKTTAASPTSAPASMARKQTSPSAPASMALKETSPTTTGSGIQAAPTHAPAATTTAPTQALAATTAAPIQASAATTVATTAVSPGSSEQMWEKGVLVKEYIMHKLEPGDDEKALSQVISQAITPKNNPGDGGVMEKVKEVVTSFLHNDESEAAFSASNEKSTSRIPLSTNAHEGVEEENHGRLLQAN